VENMTEIIIAFVTGVFGPLLVIYIKHILDKRKVKPDMVMDTLRVSELINSKIEHIKEEFDADRVWVSQFHNGGNFYPTGKSIAKFSIMYETVGQHAQSVQTNFKNIPVNLFSKSINELLNNDSIEIYDYADEKIPTFGLKYIAEETGCKSSYLFAIKTIEDKFIGILSVDYTKDKKDLTFEEVNHLQVHASSIGGVLMSYLNQ
jgi:Rps23 Pro-64 3,4-dihydroxylase Tpa1-like proline 4-hydroxylase